MKAKILVVEDDPTVRLAVSKLMRREGYEVALAADAATAIKTAKKRMPDVVVLDLFLPDQSGLEILPIIKRDVPTAEVIVLTGHGTIEAAVDATKLGAYQFLTKPFNPKTLGLHVQRAVEHKLLTEEATHLRDALTSLNGTHAPVFRSAAMKSVVHTIQRVAPSDVSILITGESGVGKEVVTDLCHSLSARCKGPLVKVNCAALPRELIESELFGSVRGAFTGAHMDREGLFQQAEGGTLLLDELSEMPIDTQSKLLRVLQEKVVRPVGGRRSQKTDCRVLAATNRDPEEAIKTGKLREDLYYRVSAITIQIPALRDRKEDILPLAQNFLQRFSSQSGRPVPRFSEGAMGVLEAYDWPGNIRQLQNEIQRALLMSDGPQIEDHDLSIRPKVGGEGGASPVSGLNLLEAVERNTIEQMLRETQGNKLETAKRLGIGRQTLYNKIKAYKLEE